MNIVDIWKEYSVLFAGGLTGRICEAKEEKRGTESLNVCDAWMTSLWMT